MVGSRNPRSAFIRSIVLLALLLMLIATSLFLLMRKNILETTEHARLTVQSATIVGPLVQHNVPTATVVLENTGNSPAQAIRARLVMTVWTAPTFPDWDMPLKLTDDVTTFRAIAPGSSLSHTISLLTPLTDVQGMHLERKDWFIVILGVIVYDDAAGNSYKTTLCLIWRDTTKDSLSSCEKWNRTD